VLLAFTVPFKVADTEVIAVAALVTTVGKTAEVVKVRSFPLEVPAAFTPTTLK